MPTPNTPPDPASEPFNFLQMKAKADQAIADTLLWLNNLDTAMLDLFHEVAGIERSVADAIIGDTHRADLKQVIRRLSDLRDLSEEAKQLRHDIFKDVALAQQYRNVIAHQPWQWMKPNAVIFVDSHAKGDNERDTVFTTDQLHAIRDFAVTLTSLVSQHLSMALRGEVVPEDDLLLESWRQKPGLPKTASQIQEAIRQSQRRQPRSR